MTERVYGWHPSVPDFRDYPLTIAAPAAALPSSSDLRAGMPPVGDQGNLGSCTAWASTAAWRYELMRQGKPDMEPSELAQYYWSRLLERTTRSDAGATIRDAVKVLAKTGAAPEALWPYDVAKFAKAPPAAVRQAARAHLALEYQAVPQTHDAIVGALAAGYPVVLGISVYESFESDQAAQTGVIMMPSPTEKNIGGHAIVLVGHHDATRQFVFRNSWSAAWGHRGYGYLAYDYVLSRQLAGDLWAIRSVEAA